MDTLASLSDAIRDQVGPAQEGGVDKVQLERNLDGCWSGFNDFFTASTKLPGAPQAAEEEKNGLVRWLRPDYQNPSGKQAATQAALLATDEDEAEEAPPPKAVKPWPKKIAEQIAAVRDRVAFPGKVFTVETVAAAFKGAKKDIEGFLDGFAALGVLTTFEGPTGKRWRAAGKPTDRRP